MFPVSSITLNFEVWPSLNLDCPLFKNTCVGSIKIDYYNIYYTYYRLFISWKSKLLMFFCMYHDLEHWNLVIEIHQCVTVQWVFSSFYHHNYTNKLHAKSLSLIQMLNLNDHYSIHVVIMKFYTIFSTHI